MSVPFVEELTTFKCKLDYALPLLIKDRYSLRFIPESASEYGFTLLVSGPISNMAFVAIKMGRRSRGRGTRGGRISDRYVTDPAAAGQPPAHFHRNPPGRGQLAVFLPPRRITPYVSIQICSSLVPVRLAPP